MDESERRLFRKFFLEGASYDEIAKSLGIIRKDMPKECASIKSKYPKECEEAQRLWKNVYSPKKKVLGEDFKFGDFPAFYDWWMDKGDKCFYCKTEQYKIRALVLAGKAGNPDGIYSSQMRNRGRNLELERKDSVLNEYSPENCELGCYFCNNDKSNVISGIDYLKYFKDSGALVHRKNYIDRKYELLMKGRPMAKTKDFSALKKLKAKDAASKEYGRTIGRLLTILSLLDKGKSLSTADLAKDLDVSQRTIQRYISLILRCGYPIYDYSPGRYAFVQGFSLRKVALTEEQASLMSFLGEIALSLGSKFEDSYRDLFQRLMATNMDSPFYAKVTVGRNQLPNTEIVKDLETAIDNCERVQIQYVSLSKGETKYVLEPLKLAFFDGFWYCLAQAKEAEKVVKFRIDRMKKVEMLEEKFVPSVDIDKMLKQSVNIWFDGVRGEKVLIKIGSEVARYFKQKTYFPLQKLVAENKDGSIVLETYPAHPEEITHTIMHWIPYLTVLEPESFKDEIKNTVTTYLKSI